jgi:hypothetical protein
MAAADAQLCYHDTGVGATGRIQSISVKAHGAERSERGLAHFFLAPRKSAKKFRISRCALLADARNASRRQPYPSGSMANGAGLEAYHQHPQTYAENLCSLEADK